MTIKANVSFLKSFDELDINENTNTRVSVDSDYVESNESDIAQWVETELEDRYGKSFVYREDFEIDNLDELIEELAYDEFEDKTTI